jgi:hypothetical protein
MPVNLGRWVVGIMMAAIGICALFIASRAEDPVMYYMGVGFFVATVLFNFFQIKHVFDSRSLH